MKFLVRLLLSALAVIITDWLLPGVYISGMGAAILVAVVLALLNTFIKPILILLTIPFTLVTLGIFLLVINAVIILMADGLVPGFEVNGFWLALLFSIILTAITYLLEKLIK